MLGRMDFCMNTFQQIKLNDRVEFPPVLDMSKFCVDNDDDEEQQQQQTSSTMTSANTATTTTPQPQQQSNNNDDNDLQQYGIDLDNYHGAHHVANKKNNCPKHGDQSLIYDLYSVLVHIGNSQSGHYINYIRPVRNTNHFVINDDATTPAVATTDDIDEEQKYCPHINNDQYTLPQTNNYQVNDEYFKRFIQGQTVSTTGNNDAQQESQQQNNNNNNTNDEKCTCNFSHAKAEYYRQGKFYKFDDETVVPVPQREAIDDNFGGATNAALARYNAGKSAYLLMYIQRRFTYYDEKTNNGNDLIYHPVVTKTAFGQKNLLPAYEKLTEEQLLTNIQNKKDDIQNKLQQQIQKTFEEEMEKVAQIKREEQQQKLHELKRATQPQDDNSPENDQQSAGDNQKKVAGIAVFKDITPNNIIANLQAEIETINEELTISAQLESYEKLRSVQKDYKENKGKTNFVQIQPPLALLRVLAQQEEAVSPTPVPVQYTNNDNTQGNCQGGLAAAYPNPAQQYQQLQNPESYEEDQGFIRGAQEAHTNFGPQ
eukprot:UN02032